MSMEGRKWRSKNVFVLSERVRKIFLGAIVCEKFDNLIFEVERASCKMDVVCDDAGSRESDDSSKSTSSSPGPCRDLSM